MSDIRKKTGKNGTTYQVRFRAAGGGYRYRSFGTRKEATAFLESDKPETTPGHSMNVRQAIDLWLDVCENEGRDGRPPVSKATLKFYIYIAKIMRSYQWPVDLRHLTKPHVVAFRSWLIREHGRYLAAKTLTYFHAVLAEMASRGHVSTNAAIGVSVQKETRYDKPVEIPSEQEIRALLRAADRLAQSSNERTAKTWKRYRPMLYLAIDSGMRPQELMAVSRGSFRDGGVAVEQAIDGNDELSVPKTRSGRRFIELSDVTLTLVSDYMSSLGGANPADLAFPTSNGTWQSQDNWRKRCFDEVCLHAGLTETIERSGKSITRSRFSPYALRHYFASQLIADGTDLAKIKTLMGHADISTTFDVYAHLIKRADEKRNRRAGTIAGIGHVAAEPVTST